MKILFVNVLYSPNIGGVENYIQSVAKELNNSKNIVEIIVSDRVLKGVAQPKKKEKRTEGIIYRYHYGSFPFSYIFSMINAWYIIRKRLRKQLYFDKVIVRNHHSALICWLAGIKDFIYIVPAIYSNQNIKNKYSKKINILFGYWANLYLQKIALYVSKEIIVLSDLMMDQVRKFLKNENNMVRVKKIPPGVDVKRFYPKEKKEKASLRESLNLPQEHKLLLAIGRFSEVKGFDIAISALIHLPDHIHLVLVGEGAEREKYLQIAKVCGIEGRLHIKPSTNQPENYYGAVNAFILPSVHEPFGQVLLEATASGLPIAAFSKKSGVTTATEEIYKVYSNLIFLAQDYSSVALANAITEMLNFSQKSNINYMAERDLFLIEYSWKNVTDKILRHKL